MLNSGTLVIPPQTLRVNPSVSFGLSPDVLAEGLWAAQLGLAAAACERHQRRDRLAALRACGDDGAPAVGALGRHRGRAADHEPPPPSTPQAEAAAVAELTVSVVRGHTPIVA